MPDYYVFKIGENSLLESSSDLSQYSMVLPLVLTEDWKAFLPKRDKKFWIWISHACM